MHTKYAIVTSIVMALRLVAKDVWAAVRRGRSPAVSLATNLQCCQYNVYLYVGN